MINTTTDQNAYDQGIKNFGLGMTDLVKGQNDQVDATSASYDPQIKNLQDTLTGFNDQIRGIKTTLNNLPQNVTDRGNGMGSAAQLSRQVTAESTPLQTNLANLGLAADPIATSLSTTQASKSAALSALNDKFARETTGYTTTAQATLNGLLDKLQNDRTLNAAEMSQAYELAKMDRQYSQTLATNSALTSVLNGGGSAKPGAGSSGTSLQSPADITSELQGYFKSGKFLTGENDTGGIIDGIMADTGMSRPDALTLYYQVRRPYEMAGGPAAAISAPVSRGDTAASQIMQDKATGKVDASGFTLYPDGTRVKDDPFNAKKHGA